MIEQWFKESVIHLLYIVYTWTEYLIIIYQQQLYYFSEMPEIVECVFQRSLHLFHYSMEVPLIAFEAMQWFLDICEWRKIYKKFLIENFEYLKYLLHSIEISDSFGRFQESSTTQIRYSERITN